ncbi:hypothetical protein AX17_002505 [Amanita inopinata Kibby_2008]|nr:hypothetical protein AX17_002505 [Amanita inopinata Kibby_2008]
MGVLGLTPFLQKTCPEVIKYLPDRLKGLAGKKIVIDGTLITQRMHFAPSPHQYRHVLGWYRLVKELDEAGVTAICVFDGKERNLAKAREHVRRKEARQLVATRSSLELKRLWRLQKLRGIWQRWRALNKSDSERVSQLLQSLDVPNHVATDAEPTRVPFVPSELESTATVGKDVPTSQMAEQYTEPPANLAELIQDETRALEQPTDSELAQALPPTALLPSYERIQDQPFPVIPPTPVSDPETLNLPPAEIPRAVASLFLDYHDSISQLSSLPPTGSPSPVIATAQNGVDLETRAELLMSKAQYQLTLEEGQLWMKIFTPQKQLEETTDVTVNNLAYKSSVMSESYRRRTYAPTSKTYDESKEILQAMGIPCIESTGAFEAEALASAIVRRGQADYVASEDTDVLVYEAPLLRNVTNRSEPLMVMSGADVRTILQLDRDSYIDFALLLGTDFSERIKNVGPARALKFIKEYGSIERVIESEVKYQPRLPTKAYLAQVELARMIFRTLPPVPDAEELAPRRRDDDEVIQLLQRFSLGREVLEHEDWDYQAALTGNYFADDPRLN